MAVQTREAVTLQLVQPADSNRLPMWAWAAGGVAALAVVCTAVGCYCYFTAGRGSGKVVPNVPPSLTPRAMTFAKTDDDHRPDYTQYPLVMAVDNTTVVVPMATTTDPSHQGFFPRGQRSDKLPAMAKNDNNDTA